jgi:hypothetical protein
MGMEGNGYVDFIYNVWLLNRIWGCVCLYMYRERTIPTERPPLVGGLNANFLR